MTSDAPLVCRDLIKRFDEGVDTLEVLSGVNLTIEAGETLAIIGESGAGKTTLLQLLGGLDAPTSGEVSVFGQDIASLGGRERGELRNRALGFVYQFHHLLPEFTALENVAMPLLLRRESLEDVRARATRLLERVGLSERLTHRPGELSGVVLADEPTGNLDHRSGERTLELMLELNAETGPSLVIVTHSNEISQRMGRVLELADGVLLPVPA